jgi:disulfide bond formation protein DsbB
VLLGGHSFCTVLNKYFISFIYVLVNSQKRPITANNIIIIIIIIIITIIIGIETTENWHSHIPKPVCQHEDITVLWNQGIQTDREVLAKRPDITKT